MPESLNKYDFPQVYGPWYKKRAKLEGSSHSFNRYDILLPVDGSGTYRSPAAADLNGIRLDSGYLIAAEPFKSGMTHVECLVPGSVILVQIAPVAGAITATHTSPFTGQLGMLITTDTAGSTYAVRAERGDYAEGRVAGRFRTLYRGGEEKLCREFKTLDIALFHTGVV